MSEKEKKPHFQYTAGYDGKSIHGIEETRPWDITQIISERIPKNAVLVDVGCGPAKKLMSIAPLTRYAIGIDINKEVLSNASRNIKETGVSNIALVIGNADALPLSNESVDVITNILSPYNAKEAWRVLKPGGFMIIENTGENDKQNIKVFFGNNSEGRPRGRNSEKASGAILKKIREDCLIAGFNNILETEGYWSTWYSVDGLKKLLKETPTIHEYDEESDRETVEKITKELDREKGIETRQHRVLLVAQKPL